MRTGAHVALVVVDSLAGHVLAVHVAVVEVVDVVGVDYSGVPAAGAMGVPVGFGLAVRDRCH